MSIQERADLEQLKHRVAVLEADVQALLRVVRSLTQPCETLTLKKPKQNG